MNIGDFISKLDLVISKDNHAENFSSRNFADILANLFSDLSFTSIDFRSSPTFPVSSSYPAISDGISGCKSLNFTSLGSPATCNLGNILAFYHWLYVYLTIEPSTNVILTDFSHLSSNSIEVK